MGMLVHSDLRECSTKNSQFPTYSGTQSEAYIPCHVETEFKGVTKIIGSDFCLKADTATCWPFDKGNASIDYLHCFIYSLSALKEGVYFTANIPFNITKESFLFKSVCPMY